MPRQHLRNYEWLRVIYINYVCYWQRSCISNLLNLKIQHFCHLPLLTVNKCCFAEISLIDMRWKLWKITVTQFIVFFLQNIANVIIICFAFKHAEWRSTSASTNSLFNWDNVFIVTEEHAVSQTSIFYSTTDWFKFSNVLPCHVSISIILLFNDQPYWLTFSLANAHIFKHLSVLKLSHLHIPYRLAFQTTGHRYNRLESFIIGLQHYRRVVNSDWL